MRKCIFVIFLFVLMLLPINIGATCSYEDEAALSKLASYVNYDYKYDKNTGIYSVVFNNVPSELKIVYNNIHYRSFNNKVTLNDISSSNEKNIYIYSSDNSKCPNINLQGIYINLPIYNKFYDSEECKAYPKFELCKEFVEKEFDESYFRNNLDEYILNSALKDYKPKEVNKNNSKMDIDFNYKSKILLIISLFLFLVLTINIFIIVRRKKK